MLEDNANPAPNGPVARDAAAELEAIVRLTGGDLAAFIEIAKSDVGFVYEPDAVAVVNNLKSRNGADYARLIARLRAETKVRIAPLEAALRAAKGDDPGNDDRPGKPLTFDTIEPWPDPVDGAALLSELSRTISSYVVMDKYQRDAVALWAVFTHSHDLRDFAPLLIAKSAIKRSGKSRLAEIIERLAPRPLYLAGLTTPFIERVIEDHRPTLIIDEADRIRKGDQALAERIDAQFNRSFRRAIAKVGKNVPLPGGGYEPRVFSTWAATFVAGIGKQADTAEDRAVVIALTRKLASEKVKPLRAQDGEELVVLARKIARFVADNEVQLRTRVPAALNVDNDRAKDVWEPLLVIAETAGGDWPARARAAGQWLVGEVEEEEEEFGVRLLSDLRDFFLTEFPDGYPDHDGRPDSGPRLASSDIIKKLLALEDRPYGALGKMQRPLTQHGLGRTLKDFRVRAGTIRPVNSAKTARGYYQRQFVDVFARYLPEKASNLSNSPIPPYSDRHNDTRRGKQGETEDFEPTQADGLCRPENAGNPSNSGPCVVVSDQSATPKDGKEHGGLFEGKL